MNVPPLAEPTPHLSLYREAMRVARSYGDRVTAMPWRQPCPDVWLAEYIDGVLRERPDARCTQEAQVAIWLHRMDVSPARFHKVWQVQAARALEDWLHRPGNPPELLAMTDEEEAAWQRFTQHAPVPEYRWKD